MAKKMTASEAMKRITAIHKQIELMSPYKQDIADRYVKKIWNLYTHNKPKLPLSIKRSFCRKCLSYWRIGRTVRIRFSKGKKIYTCLNCGAIKRVMIR